MTTFTRITEIAAQITGVNPTTLTRDTRFKEDLECDSLDIVEIVMEIEDEFDIDIDDDQIQGIETVGQLVDRVERELAAT